MATQVHDGTTKPIVETATVGGKAGHREEVTLAGLGSNMAVGTQANAWDNEAESADGTSASVDLQSCSTVSVFGIASTTTDVRVQFSQNDVDANFYDSNITFSTLGAANHWGGSFLAGARYVRLKTSQAATLTGTIAGKG